MAVEFSELNWLGLAAGVVFNMILGFVWYAKFTPMGKVWMREMKMDPNFKPTTGEMAKGMILMVVGAFFMMFVFAHNWVANTDAYKIDDAAYKLTPMDALMAGLFTTLGFIVPVLFSGVAWERKSWSLFFVNVTYYLVTLIAAGFFLLYIKM